VHSLPFRTEAEMARNSIGEAARYDWGALAQLGVAQDRATYAINARLHVLVGSNSPVLGPLQFSHATLTTPVEYRPLHTSEGATGTAHRDSHL
jgi:hypothetical protein